MSFPAPPSTPVPTAIAVVPASAGAAPARVTETLFASAVAVLASVMSLWGTAHRHLRGALAVPPGSNRKITETGNLTPENWDGSTHHCHMFRSGELRRLAKQEGLTVTALSASQCISTGWDDSLREGQEDPEQWKELLRMELEACREEGCLDTGTHIILVGKKDRGRPATP